MAVARARCSRPVAGAPLVRGGRIVRVPDPMTVVTLDQRLSEPTEAVRDFAWNFDADAMRWRARLALGDDDVSRWGTLSPGQRRRWQVGSALHSRPHVLLLDEPGNHLDAEGLAALSEALREFDGIGLLVSHDRTLLDSLCTSVRAGRARERSHVHRHLLPGERAVAGRRSRRARRSRAAAQRSTARGARSRRSAGGACVGRTAAKRGQSNVGGARLRRPRGGGSGPARMPAQPLLRDRLDG